ncbi:ABC transporter ATP-binding protein [Phenylobacterium sp.]|uniref:ABC transporter ATP-binding protein n=1 Tax=Phenylobacterium sp. TaxID=1871053 RepID=UPI0035AD807A
MPPDAPAAGEAAPIVSCRGVVKRYRMGAIEAPALNGVDLDIAAGDFATLAGPSGSGKTTLLNMIGGLDHPTAGEVIVDGVRLGGLDKDALTDLRLRKIGFVFQAYNLIPVLSAVENVEFVLQLQGVDAAERRRRAVAALKDVGLEGFENRRPAYMSGGQQQRVAVARALVAKPAIVLADEPTANLDSKTAEDLVALMARLNHEAGVTFLIGTHDARVIARTRRHIEMTDGRITADERRAAAFA